MEKLPSPYHSIKHNLVDAFSISGKGIGASFVKIPALRIDYILHDKKFESTNYIQHKKILSDHFAISCEISIPWSKGTPIDLDKYAVFLLPKAYCRVLFELYVAP